MSAVALPRVRPARVSGASKRADEPARRRLVPVELPAWAARQVRQPNTWTAGLVLTLAATLGWHHGIAKTIGTESTAPPAPQVSMAELVPPANPEPILASLAAAAAAKVKPVPTHAPVDPFRALVAADGSVRAQKTIQLPGHHSHHGVAAQGRSAVATGSHGAAAPGPHRSGCADPYVVRGGDSLWAIAADGQTTWRKVYAANRAVIGPDPSYLVAGQHLCLPSH